MKRCLIIINPSSGKHIIQNKLDRIIGQLTLQNIVEHFEIFYTEKKDDAYYKAKDCDENQYDFIMSVGGDGTLNEVISGMVDSHKKIPLCILAAGTVNDFANYLNIPSSVNGIVEMIKNFNVISSDVGKINDQYFINVAAAGMFSDISFVVSKEEKKKFGPLAYYFKGMTQLPQQLSTNLHLNVTVDNESFEEDAYMFAVSYPEGTEAKNAKDFFIAYGSALRRGNETYFSSLAKLFVIQKAEDKKLDLWISGQPKINTTFRSTKKPVSVEVNDKKIPVVYQKSQIKVKL